MDINGDVERRTKCGARKIVRETDRYLEKVKHRLYLILI